MRHSEKKEWQRKKKKRGRRVPCWRGFGKLMQARKDRAEEQRLKTAGRPMALRGGRRNERAGQPPHLQQAPILVHILLPSAAAAQGGQQRPVCDLQQQ